MRIYIITICVAIGLMASAQNEVECPTYKDSTGKFNTYLFYSIPVDSELDSVSFSMYFMPSRLGQELYVEQLDRKVPPEFVSAIRQSVSDWHLPDTISLDRDRPYIVRYEYPTGVKGCTQAASIPYEEYEEIEAYEEYDEDEPEERDEIFEIFDVSSKAEFPGGEEGLMRFIAENMNYPPMAIENEIEGTVNVMFIVTREGRVSYVSVLGSKIGYGLEDEAIRVIKVTSGMWKPAMQRDKPVYMRFRIPIPFRIY